MPDPQEMRPVAPPIGSLGPNASKVPFDVVCLKKGMNELDAKPEDFRRYTVPAADPLEARTEGQKLAEKDGFDVLHAVPPGHLSDTEQQARSRASVTMTDRSKI